mmetsp:Transcript_1609/g.3349  ORF Transcript_1609/g.3349 Transcript_1609/m.3349 type:complete len:298 (+) Transcript_1609:875-1768(+)
MDLAATLYARERQSAADAQEEVEALYGVSELRCACRRIGRPQHHADQVDLLAHRRSVWRRRRSRGGQLACAMADGYHSGEYLRAADGLHRGWHRALLGRDHHLHARRDGGGDLRARRPALLPGLPVLRGVGVGCLRNGASHLRRGRLVPGALSVAVRARGHLTPRGVVDRKGDVDRSSAGGRAARASRHRRGGREERGDRLDQQHAQDAQAVGADVARRRRGQRHFWQLVARTLPPSLQHGHGSRSRQQAGRWRDASLALLEGAPPLLHLSRLPTHRSIHTHTHTPVLTATRIPLLF